MAVYSQLRHGFERTLTLKMIQKNKETETSQPDTDKRRDIACVFSLVFKPCWNFTAQPKWRLSLNNLQLPFFKIHTCAHMPDICPLHPHPQISLCGSTRHDAIKPSGTSVVPLPNVSLKSCVMLPGKQLKSNIHQQHGCIRDYEKCLFLKVIFPENWGGVPTMSRWKTAAKVSEIWC